MVNFSLRAQRHERLIAAIAAVAPVDGISVGRWEDKATWRVDFKAEATVEQQTAAAAVITAYVLDAPVLADYEVAIQEHIDATAHAKSYADGVSLAGYVNSTVAAWAAEASSFIAWRDAVWVYAYEQLTRVQQRQRAQPSVAELLGELPAITWPA